MQKRFNPFAWRAEAAARLGTWHINSRTMAARRSRRRVVLITQPAAAQQRPARAPVRPFPTHGNRLAATRRLRDLWAHDGTPRIRSWRVLFPRELLMADPRYRRVARLYRATCGRIARRLGFYPAGVTMAAVRVVVARLGEEVRKLALTARAHDCLSRGHTP